MTNKHQVPEGIPEDFLVHVQRTTHLFKIPGIFNMNIEKNH